MNNLKNTIILTSVFSKKIFRNVENDIYKCIIVNSDLPSKAAGYNSPFYFSHTAHAWCHPLTKSGRAPSDSIYTPHSTRLLKMPLFPKVTCWQHTDTSWPHPIFWFPWVIQFYTEWYMSTCVVFVPFFCWKTWISYGNKSCGSQKGTTTDRPQQQDTKQESRKTSKHFPCLRCSESDCLMDNVWVMIRSLDVLYHGYVHIRGLKTIIEAADWQYCIANVVLLCLGLICAPERLRDPGRRGFLLPALQKSDRLIWSINKTSINKYTLEWFYCKNTKPLRQLIYSIDRGAWVY